MPAARSWHLARSGGDRQEGQSGFGQAPHIASQHMTEPYGLHAW